MTKSLVSSEENLKSSTDALEKPEVIKKPKGNDFVVII